MPTHKCQPLLQSWQKVLRLAILTTPPPDTLTNANGIAPSQCRLENLRQFSRILNNIFEILSPSSACRVDVDI
ncbi:hypothetical protein HMPREF1301_00608 [Propionibacterium sp. KPL2005]|nr:hypothetical protein HMPREF1301_00608 [Propionibacterium sp. KPL2005]ERS29502.1 hypothetical protein HMPREF1297_00317 [Propionibacterium sp. KPL2000]